MQLLNNMFNNNKLGSDNKLVLLILCDLYYYDFILNYKHNIIIYIVFTYLLISSLFSDFIDRYLLLFQINHIP